MKLLEKVTKAFKVKEIRNKILFTLAMLLIFRLLAAITTPGIPHDALKQLFGEGSFGDLMTAVSGAAFENASVVAIGLGPYINASVILQLLGSIIPALEQLQEEGERGKRIINQWTRILTIPLSILQSFVIYSILRSQGLVSTLGTLDLITMIATLTAGSMLLVWIGELIQEFGIGNGSSIIIFGGILAALPGSIAKNFGVVNPNHLILVGIGAILVVSGIIFLTESERRVDIQYAKRVRGKKTYGGGSSYIPLKINTAGVMPVIFAVSLLSFPQVIARFFVSSQTEWLRTAAESILKFLDPVSAYYYILYALFIILFTFMYTFIVFKPEDVADNLKKSGGFIQGVRPGKETSEYLVRTISRLSVIGALFLAAIALLPVLVERFTEISSIAITGTGLLIVINVVLDVFRKIESLSVSRSYEKYR